MADAINVLQAFANDNKEYQTRFGEDVRANFEKWAQGVLEFPEVYNSFCHYLINKIGRTYVNACIAYNPLAFLRGEDLEYGSTIEDMFVEMAKAQKFDPTGKETLDRKLPDVKVLYYYVNTDLTYKVSISRKEIKLAFYRAGQMDALLERITNSLYQGAQHDAFIFLKKLATGYNGWYAVKVPELDGTDSAAKANGKAMKGAILHGRFDKSEYNSAGVINNVGEGEGLLIMTADASVDLDFDYLANVFNLSKTDLQARTVIVDDLADLTGTVAVYCDKRLFQVHHLDESIEDQRNAEGRFTNYTLVIEAIYAMSKYMPGFIFTTNNTFKVTFNANGGTGNMPYRMVNSAQAAFSLPFNRFTPPTGKTFAGWALKATPVAGTDTVYNEIAEMPTPTADTVIYAQWA